MPSLFTISLALALSACAQPPALSADAAEHRVETAPAAAPNTITPPLKEAPAVSANQSPEPDYGPPIPAAELRRRILALANSFQSLEHLERDHVERIMQSTLNKREGMQDGYEYFGKTNGGWMYRIGVSRLGLMEEPPTIIIFLSNGAGLITNNKPAHCTLDFEDVAKELVAMGYERDQRAYDRGGEMAWGFGRGNAAQKAGFGIEIFVYEYAFAGNSQQACIKWLRIGGGALRE